MRTSHRRRPRRRTPRAAERPPPGSRPRVGRTAAERRRGAPDTPRAGPNAEAPTPELHGRPAARAAAQRAGRAGDPRGHHRGDRRPRHRRRALRGRRRQGRRRQGHPVPPLAGQGRPADRRVRRDAPAAARAARRVGPRADLIAMLDGDRRRRRRPPARPAVRAAARRGRALPPAGRPVQGARDRAPPRADPLGAAPRHRRPARSARTPTSRSRCSLLTGAVMARGKLDSPRPTPASPTRVVDELLLGLAPR